MYLICENIKKEVEGLKIKDKKIKKLMIELEEVITNEDSPKNYEIWELIKNLSDKISKYIIENKL